MQTAPPPAPTEPTDRPGDRFESVSVMLDRMEIDRHGPLHRVEIGPMSRGVNVVQIAPGGGKTALARFLRDSLIERAYPAGMFDASAGQVTWLAPEGRLHCHRQCDGSRAGRKHRRFESRGESAAAWQGWSAPGSHGHRDAAAFEIPEAIVDSVIVDTSGTDPARIVEAIDPMVQGLDHAAGHRPQQTDWQRRQLAGLRAELGDIEAELHRGDWRQPAEDSAHASLRQQRRRLVSLRERLLGQRCRPIPSPSAWDTSPDDLDAWQHDCQPSARLRHRVEQIDASVRQIDEQLATSMESLADEDFQADLAGELETVRRGGCGCREAETLQNRRAAVLRRLAELQPAAARVSSLAEAASAMLVRLSGHRLHQIRWTRRPATSDRPSDTVVLVDGRQTATAPAEVRTLVCLAIRLAAAESLAAIGRALPVVVETTGLNQTAAAVATTLSDVAMTPGGGTRGDAMLRPAGLQLLVLTSDRSLAGQLIRRGAKSFDLLAQRVSRAARPHWQSTQWADARCHSVETRAPGQYAGGFARTLPANSFDAAYQTAAGLHREAGFTPAPCSLDAAWSEQCRGPAVDSSATDAAPPRFDHRDGQYFVDQTTSPVPKDLASGFGMAIQPAIPAAPPQSAGVAAAVDPSILTATQSPYHLTVDSPIDHAPSIDAVAAERLKRIGISHITHLMATDSNRLADTVGMVGIDAKTIRRWQAECRLLCRVPQLRGFDARVLVGCGVTTPDTLASTHPADLLARVKTFLATERGQQILLSGTSYELSRITSWIASAGEDSMQIHRCGTEHATGQRRPATIAYDIRSDADLARESEMDDFDAVRDSAQFERRSRNRTERSGRGRQTDRGDARRRPAVDASSSHRPATRSDKITRSEPTRGETSRSATSATTKSADRQPRYYLANADRIVDAPSIGPRMAERFERIGVVTVSDLLNAQAADLAERLDHRRIDADLIVAWQQQSRLMCRVAELRGHDAQLLVAAGVRTAEQLADQSPAVLFAQIDPIAQGPEGKRILRGGALPDLAEVTDWIHHAGQHRSLRAA